MITSFDTVHELSIRDSLTICDMLKEKADALRKKPGVTSEAEAERLEALRLDLLNSRAICWVEK